MSAPHHLPAPPPAIRLPGAARAAALLALLGGGGALGWAFGTGRLAEAWSAYLVGAFFALGLAAFGVIWLSILTLSRGVWGVTMRRIPEAMTAFLLPGGAAALAAGAGAHTLYHWSHAEAVAADPILHHKAPFLNLPLFWAMVGGSVLLWALFAFLMVRNSRRQDRAGGLGPTRANAVLSALFTVVFALTLSVVAFYLLMSLDAHWFSTMYAVVIFTDVLQTGLAFQALVVSYLVLRGGIGGFVNANHLHSLVKMLFATTGFWAYIYFCQFLLIWYANIPEETVYFIARWEHGWLPWLAALPVLKFLVPFVLLVPREAKRRPRWVMAVAAVILVAQVWELFLLVSPAVGHAPARAPLLEVAAAAAFLGLFWLVFERSLARHPPVP
ncbi:MAG: hypothetical protein FJ098_04900, partial [Deltaproteobacteria bacterium]|nr:hypothetical protein [Deltaproteobacteria bacterium]